MEAGLAVSLIDRGKVIERMQILEGLPVIPDHDIVFVRSTASRGDEAVELLAQAMRRSFRFWPGGFIGRYCEAEAGCVTICFPALVRPP